MPRLFNKQSGSLIGTITEADLKVLIEQLEEEDRADLDYFIDQDTIDLLEENGAPASLVSLLRDAVGETEGIDIRWEK
jgi:hypothetical protein